MRIRRLHILGWLLALGFATISVILGAMLNRRVAMEASLRADVAGLSTHRGLAPLESPNVVLLGDSRARALGSPEIDGLSVRNLGIPGQTSAEVLARAGRDLVLARPDAAILICGVNDLKTGQAADAVGRAADATNDLLDVASSLGIPTLVVHTWPNAEVDLRARLLPRDLPERCRDLKSRLESVPRSPEIVFVSIDSLIREDGYVRPEIARDALHLNDAGNRLVIEALTPFLESRRKAEP